MEYRDPHELLPKGISRARLIGATVQRSYLLWLRTRFELNWFVFTNPLSRRRFLSKPPVLSDVQERTIEQLKNKGVAILSFSDLFQKDLSLLSRLSDEARGFAASETVRRAAASYRETLQGIEAGSCPHSESESPRRPANRYFVRLYPETGRDRIAQDNPFLQFGLSPLILDIVNCYFGLWSKLNYFDLWYSLSSPVPCRRASAQLWHRDPEDRTKIRVYLYLSPVEEGSGPLQVIPGTNLGGQHFRRWKWRSDGTLPRIPDEEVERSFPSTTWTTCTGPKGTIVIADTIGIHRGGIPRQERILAVWTYHTPASLYRRRFDLADDQSLRALSPAARFAVS